MPLLSAPRRTAALAPPLPIHNSVFQTAGITLRSGQFSILAAAPGVGKTLVATNLAIRLGVGVLYFSADSDEWTVRQRACSVLTGVKLSDVEHQLGEPAWDDYYADQLRQLDHVDWCYQSDIDMEFIVKRLFAYAELRHSWPALIVVDNLANTIVDSDNESSELRTACRELQRIARTTRSHVMALHHVKGAKESGDKQIGLGDLLYNIGKVPETILGLHRENGGVVISIPKNRGGRSGGAVPLPVDYERATVAGWAA